MAECEICGRTLKTGRKYCYEHRHSVQANNLRKGKQEQEQIEMLRYIFIKHKTNEFYENLKNKPFFNRHFNWVLISGGIILAIISLNMFIETIQPAPAWTFDNSTILNIMLLTFVLFATIVCLQEGFRFKKKRMMAVIKKAKEKIENRDAEWTDFTSMYSKVKHNKIY